jgi:hypothetical protein
MTDSPRIFLATPTYNGTLTVGTSDGIRHATKRYPTVAVPNASSLMDNSFNFLWCQALEQRDLGNATHFAMIHADISPAKYWIDTLMDVLVSRGADMVSSIVAIKSPQGLTSTAISHPSDRWRIERRLTMSEVMNLPETFGGEICPGRTLLVNNGLWLCDLRKPWCDQVCFDTENSIHREVVGGVTKRLVQCVPQDWQFSRDVQAQGGSVVATRKVPVVHLDGGSGGWRNDVAYGEWEWDQQHAGGPLQRLAEPKIEIATAESIRELLKK